jgi:tyrosyl-tRNA synthetase
VRFNSEWLAPLGTVGLIELAARYPLARMMERDDFKRRWEEGRSISLHELLYPLLQGQDSVVLKADVELGGTDQLFNLLVGRTLMREGGLEPQVVMTTPILEGLEARLVNGALQGEKMSKSLDNYVGITEAPKEMFGKLMSISDDLMWRFYALLGSSAPDALAAMKEQVRKGTLHPKQAKVNLALELVGRFHSQAEAKAAAEEFEKVFSRGALPEEIEERTLALDDAQMPLVRMLVQAGLSSSNTDARRLITQGGVTIDQERCNDPQRSLGPGRYLLRVGKRRIAYVTLQAPGA